MTPAPPPRAVPGILPDLQRAPEIVAARGAGLGRPMSLLVSTSSTNDEAKHGARQGAPHGATWVAEQQTAGRGRQGRSWWAPAGESLTFSVLVRDTPPPSRLPQIALAAGLAVLEAVAAATSPGPGAKIKWPNDVVLGGKKVAGVLVEAITAGPRVLAIAVGIGINVHTRVFPSEIAASATSVALALGTASRPPDRAQILADTLAALDSHLHGVAARGLGPFRARLEAVDALRGRRVRNDTGDEGAATGIDDDGRLLVRRDDGVLLRWIAGEVHLV
jgi:BirA family transcriptional regulator, biotin operon repressor / biotin---[acetyl-CoA-carboxylase] ligase